MGLLLHLTEEDVGYMILSSLDLHGTQIAQ
jgi:hypothetical protein